MPFAHCPDARIWWDQSGTGDPILLIMGHAYGADMWHRTAPDLAASYRVIRFDNRGVGRSSDPPGPYPVRQMAEDALAVLDAAGAASAHVYGLSLGGAIALQLALDHPGRVRSLILGCTAASAEGVSRGALLTRVRSLLPAAALNRMAWKLLYGPGTPTGRRAEDQQIVRRTRSSGRGRRGQLAGAAGFDVTGRLAEIRVPTLVLHGARDRIVPAGSAQRLADGIAGARLVMFPDAGHVYTTDVPQAGNQEVLSFLAGISGPADGSGTGPPGQVQEWHGERDATASGRTAPRGTNWARGGP
jgi:3-oxoadipate enol-lactonase